MTNSFGKVSVNSIDAIDASNFVPDKIEDGKEPKLQKNDLSTRIKRIFGKSIEPTKKKAKAIDLAEVEPKGEVTEGSGPGEGRGPKPGPGPHPGPGPGPYPGIELGPNPKKDILGDDVKYKEITVKKRLVCTNIEDGKYVLSFVSPSSRHSFMPVL